MTQEEWRPCPGYEGIYSVSSCGRIRRDLGGQRVRAGRILRQSRGGPAKSYLYACLSRDGRALSKRVHGLVAAAFLGPRPPGKEVNHLDGNGTNNSLENLEYVSHGENERHAVAMGLKAIGTRHGLAKLNDRLVREIRASSESSRSVARRLGVSKTTVLLARKGATWCHV